MDQEGQNGRAGERGDRGPEALSSGIANVLENTNKVATCRMHRGERGSSMLNGISAGFDRVPILADAILEVAASARPPAQAPDRPSSIR
jgi:hypothetical protein